MKREYEAVCNCPWCGEVPMDDETTEKAVITGDMSGCPKCGRHSYAASFTCKLEPDFHAWRLYKKTGVINGQ